MSGAKTLGTDRESHDMWGHGVSEEDRDGFLKIFSERAERYSSTQAGSTNGWPPTPTPCSQAAAVIPRTLTAYLQTQTKRTESNAVLPSPNTHVFKFEGKSNLSETGSSTRATMPVKQRGTRSSYKPRTSSNKESVQVNNNSRSTSTIATETPKPVDTGEITPAESVDKSHTQPLPHLETHFETITFGETKKVLHTGSPFTIGAYKNTPKDTRATAGGLLRTLVGLLRNENHAVNSVSEETTTPDQQPNQNKIQAFEDEIQDIFKYRAQLGHAELPGGLDFLKTLFKLVIPGNVQANTDEYVHFLKFFDDLEKTTDDQALKTQLWNLFDNPNTIPWSANAASETAELQSITSPLDFMRPFVLLAATSFSNGDSFLEKLLKIHTISSSNEKPPTTKSIEKPTTDTQQTQLVYAVSNFIQGKLCETNGQESSIIENFYFQEKSITMNGDRQSIKNMLACQQKQAIQILLACIPENQEQIKTWFSTLFFINELYNLSNEWPNNSTPNNSTPNNSTSNDGNPFQAKAEDTLKNIRTNLIKLIDCNETLLDAATKKERGDTAHETKVAPEASISEQLQHWRRDKGTFKIATTVFQPLLGKLFSQRAFMKLAKIFDLPVYQHQIKVFALKKLEKNQTDDDALQSALNKIDPENKIGAWKRNQLKAEETAKTKLQTLRCFAKKTTFGIILSGIAASSSILVLPLATCAAALGFIRPLLFQKETGKKSLPGIPNSIEAFSETFRVYKRIIKNLFCVSRKAYTSSKYYAPLNLDLPSEQLLTPQEIIALMNYTEGLLPGNYGNAPIQLGKNLTNAIQNHAQQLNLFIVNVNQGKHELNWVTLDTQKQIKPDPQYIEFFNQQYQTEQDSTDEAKSELLAKQLSDAADFLRACQHNMSGKDSTLVNELTTKARLLNLQLRILPSTGILDAGETQATFNAGSVLERALNRLLLQQLAQPSSNPPSGSNSPVPLSPSSNSLSSTGNGISTPISKIQFEGKKAASSATHSGISTPDPKANPLIRSASSESANSLNEHQELAIKGTGTPTENEKIISDSPSNHVLDILQSLRLLRQIHDNGHSDNWETTAGEKVMLPPKSATTAVAQ